MWGKVNKYTVYADRGFGAFNVALGLGMYGGELQKSLRRQPNNHKHVLRVGGRGVRGPLNNRITTGMAVAPWGSEDGET